MPIGPVSPKDMGRAGRGTSSGGSYGKGVSKGTVAAKGIGKAKPKAKGLTAAEVKTLRQARLDDAREMQEVRYTGFSPLKDRLPNLRGTGGTRFNPSLKRVTGTSISKGVQGSKLSKGKMPMTSNMEAKEGVKSGQLRRLQYSPTNSARQKPVPAKPSKTGPQTRKSVKKGK